MEVFFPIPVNFFAALSQKAERKPQPAQEILSHDGPEVPDRAQQTARPSQIEHCTQQRAQQHIEPQLTAEAQGKPEQRTQSGHHIQCVQQMRQFSILPTPQADRPQQIVDQRLPDPQQHRGAEKRQLLADIVLHAAQLNSRRQREPRSAVSS